MADQPNGVLATPQGTFTAVYTKRSIPTAEEPPPEVNLAAEAASKVCVLCSRCSRRRRIAAALASRASSDVLPNHRMADLTKFLPYFWATMARRG